jgi:putative flippase GtrA
VQGELDGGRTPLWRRPLAIRLARFTAGSMVAAAISEAVFVLVYGPVGAGPRVAAVVAFFAGAIPNWALNRRWTWQRRGRPGVKREVLPYAAVVVTTAVAATALSGIADGWVRDLEVSRPVQVGLVAMAFLLPYAAVFLLKFLLFERLVFSDPVRSPAAGPAQRRGERR